MEIKKEYIISNDKVAKIGLFIVLPCILIVNIFFIFMWRENLYIIKDYFIESKSIENLFLKIFKSLFPFIIFVGGMFMHEFLHFLPYAFFVKKKFKNITFGVNKFAFYVHTKEPVKAFQYRIITLLPSILLGFLPLTISFVYGLPWLWMFAFTSIFAGTGDLITFYLLMKIDKNEWIIDHPTHLGFSTIDPIPE